MTTIDWRPIESAPAEGWFLAIVTELTWDVDEDTSSPRSDRGRYIMVVRRSLMWSDEFEPVVDFNVGWGVKAECSHWAPYPNMPPE